MPRIRVPIPIQVKKLTRVMQIGNTDVLIHWSVFLIAAIMLASVIRRPLVTLVGLVSYIGVLFLHEAGHLVAAERKRCDVFTIDLYAVFGLTYFQSPWSRFDHCVIAWGGVLAQAIVALPIIVWLWVFGYTRFESVNVVLALFGPFSLVVAIVNLLPIRPLDGSVAWSLMPELIRRGKGKSPSQRPSSWK